MLVLSRRPTEKILFPCINATVQVVAIKPGVVRLGIEAPPEVTVVREEVRDRTLSREAGSPNLVLGMAPHQVRNRLNAATIGLALLRRQVQAGAVQDMATTLDKIEQEVRALREQVESPRRPAPPAGGPRRRKALLVEDDHNERELLAGFLRLAGLEVATAGDGADALDYLQHQEPPDVVLLDMVLPRCDGPSTVRAIRQDAALAGLTIFGVSGLAPERFHLAQGRAGVNRWFQKPVNPEQLLSDLQREWSACPWPGPGGCPAAQRALPDPRGLPRTLPPPPPLAQCSSDRQPGLSPPARDRPGCLSDEPQVC